MFRRKLAEGKKIKTWGDPTTIGFNDCPVCLVQGVEVIPKKRGENPEWRKRTKLNYHSPNSFLFAPKLFHEVKCFGFNPMHKRIRAVENICHMCEHKYA